MPAIFANVKYFAFALFWGSSTQPDTHGPGTNELAINTYSLLTGQPRHPRFLRNSGFVKIILSNAPILMFLWTCSGVLRSVPMS